MRKTIILTTCLLLTPAVSALAAVPQGFENRTGVVTEAPADLHPQSLTAQAGRSEQERLERLTRQIGQIDSFLQAGGRYMTLAAEVTQAYEDILNNITDAHARCELRRKTPTRQNSRYAGYYARRDQDCFETVAAMDNDVRQLATNIDQVVEVARDLEEALTVALQDKEDKLAQQQILTKSQQLKSTLEQAKDAYAAHQKTYQDMID